MLHVWEILLWMSHLQKGHVCKHQGLCEDLVRPDSWAEVNWERGIQSQSWGGQAELHCCPLVPATPYGSRAPSLPGSVLCFVKTETKGLLRIHYFLKNSSLTSCVHSYLHRTRGEKGPRDTHTLGLHGHQYSDINPIKTKLWIWHCHVNSIFW